VAGARSIGDPYIPEIGNTGYDVQHYTLQLALDPAVRDVAGSTSIEAISTLDNLGQISLDFVGFDVQSIKLDGAEVDYERVGKKLVVNFWQPLVQGASFTLDVAYQGVPTVESSPYVTFMPSLGLQYPSSDQTAGSLFVMSEPDGARYWFPCNDHPRDKATFRFQLTVPEDLVGAANGTLLESHEGVSNAFPDGRSGNIYTWEENYPMATYLATVVVGAFNRVDASSPSGIPMRSYVFPDKNQAFIDEQPVIGEALDWMTGMFGPYPFDKFGYAQVMAFGASLENQTLVLIHVNADENVMVHEMSHMWLGDWVSLDSWQDIWRNEGFATYISWMWEARDNPARMDEIIAQAEQTYANRSADYPLNDPPTQQMFAMDSYYRGALLVNDLRQAMGDDTFFRGLRAYLKDFGGGTASFDQFKAVMEETAGKPLDAVFTPYFQE
jgi:aminopeptidase N